MTSSSCSPETQAVPVPTPPTFFEPGGELARQLEKFRGHAPDERCFNRMLNDLDDLLRELSRRSPTAAANTKAVELAACLSRTSPYSDPVLRFLISHREGLEDVSRKLQEAAEQRYLQALHFYRPVLRSLLPQEFLTQVDRQVYAEGTNPTAADDLDVFILNLKARQREMKSREQLGLPTGIRQLDEALGGIQGLTLVSGPKGVGKTLLGLGIVYETLLHREDTAVLVYSCDMPKDSILTRLFCRACDVDYRTITGGTMTDERVAQINGTIKDLRERWLRLRVIERNFQSTTVLVEDGDDRSVRKGLSYSDLARDCHQLMADSGTSRILVFIDMIQKWDVPGNLPTTVEPDQFRLDAIDRLRQWARQSGGPDNLVVLATAELRKDAGKELSIDDLKGDGRLGSDADIVLLMSPSTKSLALNDDPVPTRIRIEKARDGGRRGDVHVLFDHLRHRFTEVPEVPKRKKTGNAPPSDAPKPYGK